MYTQVTFFLQTINKIFFKELFFMILLAEYAFEGNRTWDSRRFARFFIVH